MRCLVERIMALVFFSGAGTALLPAGEVPLMWEIFALNRFHLLNAAGIICLEHDTSTIRGIDEGQASTVALQVAVCVDEIGFLHLQVIRNGCYILIRQANIALPAAASSAALAGMNDGGIFCFHAKCAYLRISQGLCKALVMCGGRT